MGRDRQKRRNPMDSDRFFITLVISLWGLVFVGCVVAGLVSSI